MRPFINTEKIMWKSTQLPLPQCIMLWLQGRQNAWWKWSVLTKRKRYWGKRCLLDAYRDSFIRNKTLFLFQNGVSVSALRKKNGCLKDEKEKLGGKIEACRWPLTQNRQEAQKSWNDDPVVRSTGCSRRELGLVPSAHLSQVALNHL